MAATPSAIQVPAPTGSVQASVDNVSVVTTAGTVQRQVTTLADPQSAGNYQAVDNNGNAQFRTGPGLTPNLSSAPINLATGTGVLVGASAGKIARIYRLFLLVAADTNLTFEDGSNPLSGALPLLANGGITLDYSGEPWFIGSLSAALNLVSSNSVQVSGTVYYVQS